MRRSNIGIEFRELFAGFLDELGLGLGHVAFVGEFAAHADGLLVALDNKFGEAGDLGARIHRVDETFEQHFAAFKRNRHRRHRPHCRARLDALETRERLRHTARTRNQRAQ